CAQFAGGEFFVADIIKKQRLNGIDVGATAAVEFVLDHVKQTAMQTLDQGERLQVMRPDVVEARLTFGGLDRLDDGFHCDAFPKILSFSATGPVPVVGVTLRSQGLRSV